MFSFHIAFTTFKKQGFTSAEKLVFQIFFLMNIFKGQKENKRPIKCPLMDNKGHFHFELSFKGHVNKKSTASTPVLGIAVACLLLPRIRQILGSGWPQSRLRDLSQHLVLFKASERFRTKGTHLPQSIPKDQMSDATENQGGDSRTSGAQFFHRRTFHRSESASNST